MEANSRPVDALSASQWRLGLPSIDDLTPLDQPLITPNLASAFGIVPTTCSTKCLKEPESDLAVELLQLFPEKSEGCSRVRRRDESGDSGGGGGSDECYSGGDESDSSGGRAVKRPRLVWTPHLHKRFVDVIDQLGVEKAVPKTIMEMMSVEGLTRENVASHLQKYRMYLKKAEVGGQGEADSNPISSTTTGGSRDSSAFECGNGGFGGPMLPSGVNFESIASVLPLPLLPIPAMVDASVSFGYGGGPLGVAPDSGGSGKSGNCGMESGGYNGSMLWNRRGG